MKQKLFMLAILVGVYVWMIRQETSPEVMTVKANAYAISSGVDIDELSELLKTHHQAIFERAWEQMMNVDPNPDLSDFMDDIEFLGENNGCNTT